jgi:hypothetical protein
MDGHVKHKTIQMKLEGATGAFYFILIFVVLRIEAFSPGCVQVLPREGEAP